MTKQSTRESIIDAAIAVAARKGITGSSMDEIADEAKVAKGSLYYHFPSKDAIFTEVLAQGLERVAETVKRAREESSVERVLAAVVTATLEALRANPDRAKIVASEMFRTDRSWGEALAPARAGIGALYAQVLREALGDQHIQVTETAGAALFGAIAGAGLEWLIFHPDQAIEDVAAQAMIPFGRVGTS